MRPVYRYPVDRYLVESNKKFEMVNIVDDDLWEPEPALKPEDEIILRELHSMLQSTADDLKLLSGELSKYHHKQGMVQVKSRPAPLDDEFNEKVHIEELVNAKFHGFKFVENPKQVNAKNVVDGPKIVPKNLIRAKSNVGTQLNQVSSKKPVRKKLGITPLRIININESVNNSKNINDKVNNAKGLNTKPTVVYNEFSHEYVKSKVENSTCHQLQRQDMPSINIRSELKEQKVLQLDILPENIHENENKLSSHPSNVAIIAAEHVTTLKHQKNTSIPYQSYELHHKSTTSENPIRKVTRISTGESSISSNNISSDTKNVPKSFNKPKSTIKPSPRLSPQTKNKTIVYRKETGKKIKSDLNDWKEKLNSVYGQPSTSKTLKTSAKTQSHRHKSNLPPSMTKVQAKLLNNAEYIPYSKLTLGGAKVIDIERELLDLTNKDIPLSPILDKILSSHENSPRIKENRDVPKVLTTSDENLLEEVLDLERTVSQTVPVNLPKHSKPPEENLENISNKTSEGDDKCSYADDFDDENSENSKSFEKKTTSGSLSERITSKSIGHKKNTNSGDLNPKATSRSITHSKTYTKVPSLAIKKTVDIFEFVHLLDTHDNATQSNVPLIKEAQTSPKDDRPNIQPIHNELWPSIDPNGEVEKMFKLEKDFIKKVILEEYGDIIKKNLEKPSTSQQESKHYIGVNVNANQKNTQTSPAHVKCVMTSPTRTKTTSTSPFISVKVDKDNSPIVVTNEEELIVEVGTGKPEDCISINLSSPRFNLRLPSSSHEVLSNVAVSNKSKDTERKSKCRTYKQGNVSSSSSAEGDYSSSELSSLGEIKLRKLLMKNRRALNISESSCSSSVSKYSSDGYSGGILPLKSEGEVVNNFGQTSKKKENKHSKSEGEVSLRTK